jgi:aldose 1-epimerase
VAASVYIDKGFLVLRHAEARLTLDPHRGGVIREFSWGGRDVLRPTPASAGADPLDTACFPMVPFVNRVADGRFSFGGHAVQLEPNWSGDPHPLHGAGWRASWAVLAASGSRARLRFDGGNDEWPWTYRCEQCFELLPDGLSIELSVENLSKMPMPAMLGLHPYFGDAAHAVLQARLPRVWLTDGAALPVRETETPAAWRFEPARPVNAVPLDHSFSGWNGIASLRWPDRTVTLHARDCNYLHVYAPVDKDFFCVEPQTAAAGALGRNGGEAAVVAPGGRLAMRVRLAVEAP